MSLRDRLGGLNLKFSRSMLILVGSILGLIALIVVLIVVVLPRLRGSGERTAEQPTPVATSTTIEVVGGNGTPVGEPTSASPTDVAEAPSSTAEAKADPTPTKAPTQPPAAATAAPTLIEPGDGATAVAAGPTLTPLPGGGGGEELPHASGGLPWIVPVGVILLIVVVWWRLRRARATG
jgi:hypothetical protein